MESSRKGRVARGAAAASVATFAALGFHVTAGGAMPGPLGVLVPWVLSVMVCTLLAGRRLSAWRLSLAVALSQFLFHALFVVGTIDPVLASGHVHSPSALLGVGLPVPGAAGLAIDPLMIAGHVLAAALTTAMIHRGETLLLGVRVLATRLGAWLRARLTPAPGAPRAEPRPAVPADPDAAALRAPALRLPRRRGPPLLA